MKSTAWNKWCADAREVAVCLSYAARDLRHRGLWWRSALLCMAVATAWLWLIWRFDDFFRDVSGAFGMLAVGGLFSTIVIPFVNSGNAVVDVFHMGQFLLSLAKFGLLVLAVSAAFFLFALGSAILLSIRVCLRWTLLERAVAVASRRHTAGPSHGVALPDPCSGPGRRGKWAKRALALCIPVWSLFVVLNTLAALPVWSLYSGVAQGFLAQDQARALRKRQGATITMLGAMLCVLMLIPVVNLLVPALLCSSVCHLQRRAWVRLGAAPAD